LKYWKDGGQKPSEDFAKKALMKMADNYKMENVTVKPDVIDAMFRQVQDTKSLY
jgi:endoglucanase